MPCALKKMCFLGNRGLNFFVWLSILKMKGVLREGFKGCDRRLRQISLDSFLTDGAVSVRISLYAGNDWAQIQRNPYCVVFGITWKEAEHGAENESKSG